MIRKPFTASIVLALCTLLAAAGRAEQARQPSQVPKPRSAPPPPTAAKPDLEPKVIELLSCRA
jgi:hypothetical protein